MKLLNNQFNTSLIIAENVREFYHSDILDYYMKLI